MRSFPSKNAPNSHLTHPTILLSNYLISLISLPHGFPENPVSNEGRCHPTPTDGDLHRIEMFTDFTIDSALLSMFSRNKSVELEETGKLLTANRTCFQHTALEYVGQLSRVQAAKRHKVGGQPAPINTDPI